MNHRTLPVASCAFESGFRSISPAAGNIGKSVSFENRKTLSYFACPISSINLATVSRYVIQHSSFQSWGTCKTLWEQDLYVKKVAWLGVIKTHWKDYCWRWGQACRKRIAYLSFNKNESSGASFVLVVWVFNSISNNNFTINVFVGFVSPFILNEAVNWRCLIKLLENINIKQLTSEM